MVITIKNLRIGLWLGIWWFGSKDLFSQLGWTKGGGMFSRLFFGKKNSLKIKHLKKIQFFLVFEYGNLIGVKTNRDRLGNSEESILEQRVQTFGFGKGGWPHRSFKCCPVVAFSFFYLLRSWAFKNFLISALDCPFEFSP